MDSEETHLPVIERTVSVLLHSSFLLTGVVTTLLGPILPVLARQWGVTDTQSGYLFTSQFFSSMAGVAASGEITVRRGYRFTLALGLGLMAVGVASLGFGSWPAGIVSCASYGAGLGFVIPATNLLVARADPRASARRLNVLNLFWTLGAVAWPGLAALGREIHVIRIELISLGFSLAIAGTLMAIRALPRSEELPENSIVAMDRAGSSRRTFPAIALGASFFLYVGVETSLTGWGPTYAMRMTHAPSGTALLMPSFFWGAMILGRAIAPILLRQVSERLLYLGSLGTAIAGTCLFLSSGEVNRVIVGLGFAGLGLAPLFPCLVSSLSDLFGADATRAGGLFFVLAGLGGAILPWAVGLASSRSQNLRVALAVAVVAQFCLLALRAFNRGRTPWSRETTS